MEKLSDHVGYKVSDVGHLVYEGKVNAFYNMGEDPIQTEPDARHLTETAQKLDVFICQDIFMTQSTELADVILPATSWAEHDCTFTACDRTFQYSVSHFP